MVVLISISDAATIDIEGTSGKTHTFSDFPDSAVDIEETSEDVNLIPEKQHGMWSFAYYQQLFDVDTATVTSRIKESVMPFPSRHTDSVYIGGKPDLYGPVWISATLVLIIGVCSDLNNVFDNMLKPNYIYTPHFEQLYIAGIIIFSYVFIIPLLVYTWMCWKNNNSSSDLSASHLISSYGYSLSSFVPLPLILLVRSEAFDWIVLLIVMSVTGSVLVMKLWPKFQSLHKTIVFALAAFIFLLHVAVTVLLKVYFFSHNFDTVEPTTATTVLSASTLAMNTSSSS